jgi:micrococcal nuclease
MSTQNMFNKKLLAISLLFLFFCNFPISLFADNQRSYKVIEILDGDTIRIDTGEQVRLVGINTPEVTWDGKPLECWGEQAHYYLVEILLNQRIFLDHAYTANTRDVNGRILAYVYKSNNNYDINKHMIDIGYARNYPDYTHRREVQFAQSENFSKAQKLGFWGNQCNGSTYMPPNSSSTRAIVTKTTYKAPMIARYSVPNLISTYYTGN